MSNLKKYMPKVLSGVLSLTILCSTIGAASYSAGAKSTGAETTNTNISDSSSTAKNASEDKTKKLSKNETAMTKIANDATYGSAFLGGQNHIALFSMTRFRSSTP